MSKLAKMKSAIAEHRSKPSKAKPAKVSEQPAKDPVAPIAIAAKPPQKPVVHTLTSKQLNRLRSQIRKQEKMKLGMIPPRISSYEKKVLFKPRLPDGSKYEMVYRKGEWSGVLTVPSGSVDASIFVIEATGSGLFKTISDMDDEYRIALKESKKPVTQGEE